MPEIIVTIILFIGAYLLGSMPMAYLVVKLVYKVDIRKYGSGQVGGSNVYRSFSKKLGILVGIYDIGKGVLIVWIAQLLGLGIGAQALAGIGVIIGHNWPVFLRFNAGRGLAATVGVGLFLLPMGFPAFLFCAVFTLLIGSSPLPLLCAVATLSITSLGLNKPLELTLGLAALFVIMVIRRLTAPRTSKSQQVSKWELYKTRFLFDRDIKDGNTWINRKPVEDENGEQAKKVEIL
ncbi:MAG: glycerol-3-phosphate acyltransferase [Dehalococcoidales bacterium]|nr:glycerol-3-phosphate acyltransferase [Dehalococcoidales bacterium]